LHPKTRRAADRYGMATAKVVEGIVVLVADLATAGATHYRRPSGRNPERRLVTDDTRRASAGA
jgi:hypothetical protein